MLGGVEPQDSRMVNAPQLLYLVTEDWYFYTHRRQLAIAMLRSGYDVTVATRVGRYRERLEADGMVVVPIGLRRRSLNPLREFAAIREVTALYQRLRPDVVHHVGMKPVVYGTFAASLARVPAVVNALGGLGYVFASHERLARALRGPISWALRRITNRPRTRLILQTEYDRSLLGSLGVKAETMRVIRSAGVDLREFSPSPQPQGVPVVLVAARLLWDKGIGDFVEAARRLRGCSVEARFVLVGQPDPDNPRSIPLEQLRAWEKAGDVEWWGHREDMPAVFAASAVVCLPSVYGEGIPKVLIEAAACARPLVATALPGCREIVRDGENGLIVPGHDPEALAGAIEALLSDADRRERMGHRSRQIAEAEFAVESVVRETMAVYESVLDAPCRNNQ